MHIPIHLHVLTNWRKQRSKPKKKKKSYIKMYMLSMMRCHTYIYIYIWPPYLISVLIFIMYRECRGSQDLTIQKYMNPNLEPPRGTRATHDAFFHIHII